MMGRRIVDFSHVLLHRRVKLRCMLFFWEECLRGAWIEESMKSRYIITGGVWKGKGWSLLGERSYLRIHSLRS